VCAPEVFCGNDACLSQDKSSISQHFSMAVKQEQGICLVSLAGALLAAFVE
jgi:hypothetical protein